jgi:hypothetical protein
MRVCNIYDDRELLQGHLQVVADLLAQLIGTPLIALAPPAARNPRNPRASKILFAPPLRPG